MRELIRRLRHCRRGSMSVEFAIVSVVFFPLVITLFELALLVRGQNALQMVADMTARCVAISSPACATPSSFATSAATKWVNASLLPASGVSVTKGTTCSTAPGTAVKVVLTSAYFANQSWPAPFNTITISATACYPTSP